MSEVVIALAAVLCGAAIVVLVDARRQVARARARASKVKAEALAAQYALQAELRPARLVALDEEARRRMRAARHRAGL